MNRIDRPAIRVSSHRRRAAALAQFVQRHRLMADADAHGGDGQARAPRMAPMTIEMILREEDE